MKVPSTRVLNCGIELSQTRQAMTRVNRGFNLSLHGFQVRLRIFLHRRRLNRRLGETGHLALREHKTPKLSCIELHEPVWMSCKNPIGIRIYWIVSTGLWRQMQWTTVDPLSGHIAAYLHER